MKEYIEVIPWVLLTDFLRYFIAAGASFLLFWVIFKKKLHHRFIQSKFPKPKQFWFEFRYSMSTVLIFATVGWSIHVANHVGYTQIYDTIAERGWAYLAFSIVIMMVAHDFYFYWTHRLMHHPRIFKHVHLVHHQSTNPSPWAAYSFHPLEALIQTGIFPIITFGIPAHPLALSIFLIYMIVRNVQGHLGFELAPSGFLKFPLLNWHTTTVHHNMHHERFDCNYGLYFTWLDNLFGTAHKDYQQHFEKITTRKKQDVISMVLLFILPFTNALAQQSPEGLWMTYRDDTGDPLSQIRVEKNAKGELEGKITTILPAPWEGEDPICSQCTGERKGKKVIGMIFLWDFEKKEGEWLNGKILDPASGETYTCKLWMKDKKILQVRGYAGPMDLFYRTQSWQLHQEDGDNQPETGIWKTVDDKTGHVKSLVEISLNSSKLQGKIIKVYPHQLEANNAVCDQCEEERKGAKVAGMKILWGFQPIGNRWEKGSILDPGNGKVYSSSLWLEDDNTLKLRGYWGVLYRTQTWKRIKEGK